MVINGKEGYKSLQIGSLTATIGVSYEGIEVVDENDENNRTMIRVEGTIDGFIWNTDHIIIYLYGVGLQKIYIYQDLTYKYTDIFYTASTIRSFVVDGDYIYCSEEEYNDTPRLLKIEHNYFPSVVNRGAYDPNATYPPMSLTTHYYRNYDGNGNVIAQKSTLKYTPDGKVWLDYKESFKLIKECAEFGKSHSIIKDGNVLYIDTDKGIAKYNLDLNLLDEWVDNEVSDNYLYFLDKRGDILYYNKNNKLLALNTITGEILKNNFKEQVNNLNGDIVFTENKMYKVNLNLIGKKTSISLGDNTLVPNTAKLIKIVNKDEIMYYNNGYTYINNMVVCKGVGRSFSKVGDVYYILDNIGKLIVRTQESILFDDYYTEYMHLEDNILYHGTKQLLFNEPTQVYFELGQVNTYGYEIYCVDRNLMILFNSVNVLLVDIVTGMAEWFYGVTVFDYSKLDKKFVALSSRKCVVLTINTEKPLCYEREEFDVNLPIDSGECVALNVQRTPSDLVDTYLQKECAGKIENITYTKDYKILLEYNTTNKTELFDIKNNLISNVFEDIEKIQDVAIIVNFIYVIRNNSIKKYDLDLNLIEERDISIEFGKANRFSDTLIVKNYLGESYVWDINTPLPDTVVHTGNIVKIGDNYYNSCVYDNNKLYFDDGRKVMLRYSTGIIKRSEHRALKILKDKLNDALYIISDDNTVYMRTTFSDADIYMTIAKGFDVKHNGGYISSALYDLVKSEDNGDSIIFQTSSGIYKDGVRIAADAVADVVWFQGDNIIYGKTPSYALDGDKVEYLFNTVAERLEITKDVKKYPVTGNVLKVYVDGVSVGFEFIKGNVIIDWRFSGYETVTLLKVKDIIYGSDATPIDVKPVDGATVKGVDVNGIEVYSPEDMELPKVPRQIKKVGSIVYD